MISYLVLSDIHLGARSTSAKEILDHLTSYFRDFSDDSELAKVDAIFIAGDLWDTTVQFASDVIVDFVPWFRRFLLWASRNGILVRVLEGTPIHDRRQGRTLMELVDMSGVQLDFKYVAALSIEYIAALDLRVLYVPDMCRPTTAVLENDIDLLLKENQLEQVDLAIVHGMFRYQLGNIPINNHVLDEDWFLARVKNYIHIGHIHTHSQHSRIVAQGSFDRLAHGEEEAKGGVLVKQINENEFVHFFIENRQAKTYLTIPITGTAEAALVKINKAVKKLRHGSYVRITGTAKHPLFQNFDLVAKTYPLFTFSKKIVDKETETAVIQSTLSDYTPVVLNQETIVQAIALEVEQRNNLSANDRVTLTKLLESLKD